MSGRLFFNGIFCGCTLIIASVAVDAASAAITISDSSTANVSCSAGVCTATAQDAILNVTDLANMLANGATTVRSGSEGQDIEIDAPFSWSSNSRLTLDSYHSITFNKAVSVTGFGALTITTNDGGTGGGYSFVDKGTVNFRNTGSGLVINGATYGLVRVCGYLYEVPNAVADSRSR